MGDLMRIRNRFTVGAVLLALISLGLLGYLFWPRPRGSSPAELQGQFNNLKNEVALWQKSNPDKIRADLNQFYSEDVPGKWSEILQRMEKLFQETGVTSSGIHYRVDDQDKTAPPGIDKVEVQTTVTGDYSKVARFINALEQDKTFFIIDKISLSSHEGGTVSLGITVDTFLKQPS